MTTSGYLDADVDAGELIDTEEEDGFVQLGTKDLGSKELERRAVHLNEALALHTARDRCQSGSVSQPSQLPEFLGEFGNALPVAFFFLPKTWTACGAAMLTCDGKIASCLTFLLEFPLVRNLCVEGKTGWG